MDLSKYGVSSDNKILGVALTHTSYANEHNVPSYERLEYLGDAVLELIMSDYFYKNTDYPEGKMSKIRSSYVCEAALDKYAEVINLKDYKVEKEIKTENNLIFSSFIEMENKLIICKEKKEFLYYFDFKSFELKQLKPHCDPCGPNIVKINNKRFISNNGKLNLTIWEITMPQEQKIIKKK